MMGTIELGSLLVSYQTFTLHPRNLERQGGALKAGIDLGILEFQNVPSGGFVDGSDGLG